MSQGNLAELLRPEVSGPVLNDFGDPVIQICDAEVFCQLYPSHQLTRRIVWASRHFALAEAQVGLEIYRRNENGSLVRGLVARHSDDDWKAIQWCKEWMTTHDASVLHLEQN